MVLLEGFDRPYYVASDGEVYSEVKGKLRRLTGTVSRHGYRKLTLKKDGKSKAIPVHRLVAKAYLEGFNEDSIVLHKDDNRADNSVDNLYLGTKKDNAVDAVMNGKHSTARLTYPEVATIRYELRHTNYKEIAKKYGVSETIVKNILTGVTWRHMGPLNLTQEQMELHFPVSHSERIEIADKVRAKYKKNKELTAKELADEFGVAESSVRRMLAGTGRFSHLSDIRKGRNQRVTPELAETIIKEAKTGKRLTALAEKYNVHLSTVSRIVSGKMTYKHKEKKGSDVLLMSKGKELKAKDIKKIRDAYRNGQTPKRIWTKLGISEYAVRRILRGEVDGSENLLPVFDGKLSQYGRGTYYAKGEAHYSAKLSNDAVHFIRRTVMTGEYSKRELSKLFDVSMPVVYYAATGVTWQHV